MIFQLKEIQKMRKMLGLTQSQLSKLSSVSQSLIAKIEAGKIDPSYSKASKLYETLQKIQRTNSKKVRDVMEKNVITVNGKNKINEAVELMHEHAISQLPVIDNKEIVGSISEKTLITKISNGEHSHILFNKKINQVMDPPFPTVNEDTPLEVLIPILNFYSATLVTDGKYIKGIITRADLLKST